MKQESVIVKALDSIQTLASFDEIQLDIIRDHLIMVYVAGLENNRRETNKRPIVQMLNGREIRCFDSLQEAYSIIGSNRSTIFRALNRKTKAGKARTCKGYEWKYQKQDEQN
jgi:hypothetical protein